MPESSYVIEVSFNYEPLYGVTIYLTTESGSFEGAVEGNKAVFTLEGLQAGYNYQMVVVPKLSNGSEFQPAGHIELNISPEMYI